MRTIVRVESGEPAERCGTCGTLDETADTDTNISETLLEGVLQQYNSITVTFRISEPPHKASIESVWIHQTNRVV